MVPTAPSVGTASSMVFGRERPYDLIQVVEPVLRGCSPFPLQFVLTYAMGGSLAGCGREKGPQR